MINKFTKFISAAALIVLIALVGSVFAYTDITTISAGINGEVKDTLSANITSTDTTISVAGTSIATGLALIGNEVVNVTGGGGSNSLTVTRGQNGTTASAHSTGDTIRQIKQNVDVNFTPNAGSYALGDKVIVYIPNQSPNSFGSMTDVTATITETGDAEFEAATYDIDARTITFKVTTAGTTSATTVAISNLIMPDAPGQYILPVEIRASSDTLNEMGDAILSWANQVRVRAIIQPALIFTIDKSNVDITANPSLNDGENYAQKSVLTVATNALHGYTISAKLEGKQDVNTAQLDSATTSEVIATGNTLTTENTFGYAAYNTEVTKTRTEVKTDAANGINAFANTSTILTLPDDSTNIGNSTFTNEQKHTVYYGLNVDYLIPSAEYEGLITYTATPSF